MEDLLSELEKWKNLYYEELEKNQHLERQLRARPRSLPQSPGPAKPVPPVPELGDPQREAIKTKLRLACSQNDRVLLEISIREAEALGMPEAEYARRKLNSLSST